MMKRSNAVWLILMMVLLITTPASAMTYDSATDTWTDADGNIISEDDLPPTDLSEYSHSFYIHKTYTAGDVILEINTITIGGATWTGEEEIHGYMIDVDYHVWVDTKDVKKYALYGISDGELTVNGTSYPLQYQSMSAWDETYNHSGMADYRSGQDKFLQSFSLREKDLEGNTIELPELYDNTPMELKVTLNDRTNEVSTEVVVRINEQLMQVSDGEHTAVFRLNDTSAAKSLFSLLPMTVDVEDYSSNEKIFYPAEALDTSDVVEGSGGAGGLAYFSPWGNVVMYYGEFGEYPGLYILGEAVEGADQIEQLNGTITVEATH